LVDFGPRGGILRLTFNDELQGFTNVVALVPLQLHSKHHSVLQEAAVKVRWNISRAQRAQIESRVRVHSPRRPLFDILSKHKLLLHRHLTIPASLWITATVATALYFLMETALEVILDIVTLLC